MHLYADNPHYVELRGKPVLLVGSGEHYGAVLNAAFDYRPYLDSLAGSRLNLLRIFSGTYREMPGEFGIKDNNLAPALDDFLSPWERTENGRFDLTRFNEAYLARLHDFMRCASEREIVVEFSLFCFWYTARLWEASPMHPVNNLQGVGPVDKERVYSLRENALLSYQDALVEKLVTELNGYDNLYFEVCNEPYSRHDHSAYLDWQYHIAEKITSVEQDLPNQHLIAINFQNRTQRIPYRHPAVSVCNFHYATPDAAKENYHLECLISDDETGFAGQIAFPYRCEAWSFMLAGGGAFDHLDYSFTCDHPDGKGPIEGNTPGYGGEDLRAQLGFLRRFLEEHEVWKMVPFGEIFAWNAGILPAQVMGIPGELYLAYFADNRPGSTQMLALPGGKYDIEWINPVTGNTFGRLAVDHLGGYVRVELPSHASDLLMKVKNLT